MQSQYQPTLRYEYKHPAQQFFTLSKVTPTMFVSMCSISSGGCHSFGKSLAEEFKGDYVAAKHFPLELFQEKAKSQPYETMAITGCGLTDKGYDVVKFIANKYDCSNLKDLFLVFPPHHSGNVVPNYTYYQDSTGKSFNQTSYKITLLTTGIQINPGYSIGLPKLIPTLSEITIPKNCFGLMYINILVQSGSPIGKKFAEAYLENYFSQISKLARTYSESNPVVTAVTTNILEQAIIEKVARDCKVAVKFLDRLPQADFIKTIKLIGEKGGIIACNGAQTLIQANLMGCKVLFYSNLSCNNDFCEELTTIVPDDLKDLAKVVLGQSDRYELLDDQESVKKIYALYTTLLKDSSEKFGTLNKTLDLEPYIYSLCLSAKDYFVPQDKMKNSIARDLAKKTLASGLKILTKAMQYRSELSEDLIKEINLAFTQLVACYKNLAAEYYFAKKFNEAEKYYTVCLNLCETYLPTAKDQIFTILSNLITTAYHHHEDDEVITLAGKAEKILPELKSASEVIKGKIYFHKAQVQLRNLHKKLSASTKNITEINGLISDIQKAMDMVSESSKKNALELNKKLEPLQKEFLAICSVKDEQPPNSLIPLQI